jgi:hypothetical protein
MTSRIVERYESLVDATLNVLYAKGYKLEPQLDDLKSKLLNKLGKYNVYTLHGEPSRDVIERILSSIYEMKFVIIKDEYRNSNFKEVKSSEYIVEPKKAWVM